MTQVAKRAANVEDRISVLPSNAIDCILEFLPIQDAARTSILSQSWRYVFAMLPYLVLDKLFCKALIEKSKSIFKETVDDILLHHLGDIVKFVLDVSGANFSSNTDIDRWILYVTRNSVKDLTLNLSNNITYKLPSYIFKCPTLTYLKLINCVFKPPTSFLGFQNLRILYLGSVTFVPTTEFCVIKAPLLVNLTLKECADTQYLKIVSPRLTYLAVSVCVNHYLDLNCVMSCKPKTTLSLLGSAVDDPKVVLRLNMKELIFSIAPTLEKLQLSSFFLELLSADTVPKVLSFNLNYLWFCSLVLDFGRLDQASYAMQLILHSPNLSKLEIWVYATSRDSAEAVRKYLDAPACLDRPVNNLKDVTIHMFKGSKTELLFVKLLFAYTPSLIRMRIKQGRAITRSEERNITTQLMRFPRASPKAELIYLPSAD